MKNFDVVLILLINYKNFNCCFNVVKYFKQPSAGEFKKIKHFPRLFEKLLAHKKGPRRILDHLHPMNELKLMKSQHGRKCLRLQQRKHLSNMVPTKNQQNHFKQKVSKFISWYDEFTGMDEVRKAQSRVLEDEQKFREAQEERRLALNELTKVQAKLKDLYTELDSTNRGEDRYVTLVTEEHKLLKEEKAILDKFKTAEKLERECFAALSSSVKISHEKERAQGERTKYWSIIGSVMGTILGILGSSVNNYFKMLELKDLIRTSSDKQLMENFKIYVATNEKLLNKFQENEKHCNSFLEIEKLLKRLALKVNELEMNIESFNRTSEKHVSKADLSKSTVTHVENVEKTMKEEFKQTKVLLISLVVLNILMPLITRYT